MVGAGGPALAKAPMAGVLRPQVYRFKLGGFEVTTVFDGAVQPKAPHKIFGANQKPALRVFQQYSNSMSW